MRNRTSNAGPKAKRPGALAHLQPRASSAHRRDSRHARKCNVCRHPDRDAIEQDFLRWRSPDQIAEDYGIADHSSVYRHVHATGLFARRRATLRLALEPLIEQAATVRVTAAAIVSAIRVYAHINDSGEWIDSSQAASRSSASSGIRPEFAEGAEASPPLSNRQTVRVEHAPTR